MKILQLSKCADPAGGAELYMLALVEELRRQGHQVVLFGTSPTRSVSNSRERVIRREGFVRDGVFVDERLEESLRETLESVQPDVIHVHNLWGASLGVDRILAAHPAPLIQTVHDWSTFCPNSWCVHGDGGSCAGGAGAQCFQNDCVKNALFDAQAVLVTRMREQLLADGVDVALVPSLALTQMVLDHGFKDVRHLPYFIDRSQLVDAVSEERETDHLLFLGRVQPEKGTLNLIEAMPHILQQRPNARLTFVGSGSQLGEVKARATALGVADRIEFHKKVPYAEVKRFYAEATALILPSIWSENSPMTCYESLFVGLPMIGTRIGGIPELVVEGETGLLVQPRDARDLAEKIVQFCSKPTRDRAEFSRNCRALAAQLTLERNLEGVLKAYNDALERGSAAKPTSSLPLDDDFMAIANALTGELHRSKDLEKHLERLVREVVDKEGVKALLTPNGIIYGARKVAKKIGLPKFFGK